MRQLRTALLCAVAFSAFGVQYVEGQEVPLSDTETWPPGTLETRLENKSVRYGTLEVEPETTGEPHNPDDTDPFLHPELLDSFTKGELQQFVREHFGAEQAAEIDPAKLNKNDMLLAVKTLVAIKGDPKAS